jgi:hypothetical protein
MSTVADVAPVVRTVEFAVAPDLSNVDAEDKGLVELVGLVGLNLHKPAVVCSAWRVDSYSDHYNLIFDFVPTAPPISDGHMRVLKDINYIRIQRVWAQHRDGHLQLSVQLAKANLMQVVTEENVVHIARVCRIVSESHDPRSDSHKRSRTPE